MRNIRSRNFSGTKCATICASFFSQFTYTQTFAHCILHIAYIGDFILFYFLNFFFSAPVHLSHFIFFGRVLLSWCYIQFRRRLCSFWSFVCVLHLKSSVLLPFHSSTRFSLKNTMEKLQQFPTVFFSEVISSSPMIHRFFFPSFVSYFFSFIHILQTLERNVLWVWDFYFV